MEKREDFVMGVTVGGILILCFYALLFLPVVWLYTLTPTDYRNILEYVLIVVFTIMLINSARGAYQSLKVIKNYDSIIHKVEKSIEKNVTIKSYIQEGLKYRILVELALF